MCVCVCVCVCVGAREDRSSFFAELFKLHEPPQGIFSLSRLARSLALLSLALLFFFTFPFHTLHSLYPRLRGSTVTQRVNKRAVPSLLCAMSHSEEPPHPPSLSLSLL